MFFGGFVPLSLASAAGCSGDEKSAAVGSKTSLSEKYQQIGSMLGQTLASLKSSAITEGSVIPAEFGDVAPVPKGVTGGVDITRSQSGKSGEQTIDLDGLDGDESAQIFVPDVPTTQPGTAGTTVTLPSFVAWKGDRGSGDSGLCYLAWTKGASWLVASTCGDATGAWVCQIKSSDISCQACSVAGECSPCDLDASSFSCQWP
jgi:hypothetical protein